MAVNITGTVLASLFYDNSSSNGDQTGFLVGEVVHHVKDTISDSQINNVEVKTKTCIFDCVPCPGDQLFYNTSGEILRHNIIELLPNKHQNIVGWYSFRRNSTLRPSFRERLLHHNLTCALGQDVSMFVFLLCSSRASTNKSTHTFDHSFLHLDNNIFKKVPVDIINLGDTTHAEYRCAPSHMVTSKHGAFSGIVKTHEGEFLNPDGHMEVRQIQMLNGAIRRKLDNISQSVIDSEAMCSDLEKEVALLRKRAELKLLEKQQQSLKQKKPQVNQSPTLDDILSMDPVDDLPSEILQGQGHSERNKGHSVSEKVNLERVTITEQNVTNCNEGVNKKKNQSSKGNLTTPVVLHTRSSSSPVDIVSDSSHLNAVRTRSKSGDTNVGSKGEGKVKMDIDDTKSEPSARKGKNSDPFDFVGSMIAESKKDSHKLPDCRKIKKNDHDSDVPMETEENVWSKQVNHKQTKHNTGAEITNQNSRTTRSQRLKGQEQESVFDGTGEKSDNSCESKDKINSRTNKKAERNYGNMKTSGQNVGQRQQIEIVTDESSDSQDTYEMDVSSSPVY